MPNSLSVLRVVADGHPFVEGANVKGMTAVFAVVGICEPCPVGPVSITSIEHWAVALQRKDPAFDFLPGSAP